MVDQKTPATNTREYQAKGQDPNEPPSSGKYKSGMSAQLYGPCAEGPCDPPPYEKETEEDFKYSFQRDRK